MTIKIEKMEFHRFCLLFPQATERELSDMADDISRNGLTEPIVRYEGRILDGRNRYLACEMAKVEPHYVDYKGDEPLQFVISKNFHRRHLNESQRATVAHDVYELSKGDGVSEQTLDAVAVQFNVSPRMVDKAAAVKKSASEAMQQAVRDGTAKLSAVADAIKKATKATGVKVTASTPDADKEKAFAAQEQIMNGGAVEAPPEPTKKPKHSPNAAFKERVLSGEYDGKKWQRNIDEIQSILASMERLPFLYNDCYDLIGKLDQEILLNTYVSILIDVVEKVKARTQRNDKTDYTEVIIP